jgi:hypothetical protein
MGALKSVAPRLRKELSADKPSLKSVLEFCRCLSILDHDKVVVLSLEAGSRKVRGARAQHMAIDLVAFKVHQGRAFLLDTDFHAGSFGQSLESLRSLGFSQSTGIEINTHFDATIGRVCECLNDRPVRQNIGRKIDFMFVRSQSAQRRHARGFRRVRSGLSAPDRRSSLRQ